MLHKGSIASRPLGPLLMLSLVGFCFSATTFAPTPTDFIKTFSSSKAFNTTVFAQTSSIKPLVRAVTPSAATSSTNGADNDTQADVSTESALASRLKEHPTTKGRIKSAARSKLTTSTSSDVGAPTHAPGTLQRPGAPDCELPVLPRDSRLWRGNETHELNLPVTVSEECVSGAGASAGFVDEDCPPAVVSWEGSADIQSGDVLIVRIANSLIENIGLKEMKNKTLAVNASIHESASPGTVQQASVYAVTRLGLEHCDRSDGMLLDVAPLADVIAGTTLVALYDKDLTEGVNLLIVVSERWGSQCVRLRVTVKSDNCGDGQDCSGNGVCYTNVSMEGYECQCCRGVSGPHCEQSAPCDPPPCLNHGICVELLQAGGAGGAGGGTGGGNYHCLCPYGFTGRKCEKDPCYSGPCLNGGSCMSMASNGSTAFHCECAAGWAGARCERPAAEGGPCAAAPCHHGICVEQKDEGAPPYLCYCQPGYTGERCELEYDECESAPCANGGTCTDRVGGFSCACGRGYSGPSCQLKVDLCSPNPCPGHRFCIDRGNNYACECPRGFDGEECTIPTRSICDNNPCAHGGTCWDVADSFSCSCRPGYTGKLCEEDFILETVVGSPEVGGVGGAVREGRLPLGLYHDRLHNVYIAAGTLGAAIAIVGLVVTACHCRVNKTYSRLWSRLSRVGEAGPPRHWLQDKRAPPAQPHRPHQPLQPHHSSGPLDTTDMYYTLDFSDSQSSPLIQ